MIRLGCVSGGPAPESGGDVEIDEGAAHETTCPVLVTILGGHGGIYTAALCCRIMPAAHASAGGDGRQRRGLRLSMSVFYV